MLQHLLRRLVFDVPILNEYAKMPLKVEGMFEMTKRIVIFTCSFLIVYFYSAAFD